MNQIFLVSLVLLGNMVSACPDLAGNWTCNDPENGTYTMSITQEPTLNGILYHIAKPVSGTLDILSDGNVHPFIDGETTGTQTAACTSESVINIHTVAKENSGNFSYDMTTTVNKTSSNHFDMSMSGMIETPDQPKQEVNTHTPCDL